MNSDVILILSEPEHNNTSPRLVYVQISSTCMLRYAHYKPVCSVAMGMKKIATIFTIKKEDEHDLSYDWNPTTISTVLIGTTDLKILSDLKRLLRLLYD